MRGLSCCPDEHELPPAVSHHLRMLRQGNLVIDHRQGKEVFYSLADDHVVSILSLGMEHVTE